MTRLRYSVKMVTVNQNFGCVMGWTTVETTRTKKTVVSAAKQTGAISAVDVYFKHRVKFIALKAQAVLSVTEDIPNMLLLDK